jgi:predicted RNA-binding Zn-ribbon protein involved in translation (DUF1610 family)
MSTDSQGDSTTCRIARSPDGKVKLHHDDSKGGRIILWEPIGETVVETIFDTEGGILVQSLLKMEGTRIHERTSTYMKNAGLGEAREVEFTDVKLNKRCPNCGKDTLSRRASTVRDFKDIPIMPIYDCTSCRWRSYYLTDTYLTYLVHNNKELFDHEESSELEKDERQFLGELKEYIIRIFASKRILCIK